MGKMVRIPAGNTTNEHYNFVVAKPLVYIKILNDIFSNLLNISVEDKFLSIIQTASGKNKRIYKITKISLDCAIKKLKIFCPKSY